MTSLATSDDMQTLLNSLLNLTPLTLIEVASPPVMREAFRSPSSGRFECPYWFFQYVDADGMLVVAAAGGRQAKIDAIDVMNVIPMQPVRVMAMPSETWLQRLSMDHGARRKAPAADCYEPASVMSARRERTGTFSYCVWFDRTELNTSPGCLAPLMDGEHRRIEQLTRRARMPVDNMKSPSYWSADNAAAAISRLHAKKAAAFFDSALKHNSRRTSKLAGLDAAVL